MKKITFLLLLAVITFTVHAQIITSVAGNGAVGFYGDGGAATAAEFNLPSGVAFDNSGNMYIAVRNNDRIRKVNSSGIISTVAGGGSSGLGDGGQATAAQLNTPYDVALDNLGNIYIADASDARIRKVTASTGVITTIAGNGHAGYTGDGSAATAAELNNPIGIALDASGNVYVAEQGNSVIRMINTSGTISTFAGNGVGGYSGDGGPATSAEIKNPYTVTVDIHGNVYIADKMNFRVRKVTAGTITTIAGNGTSGSNGNNGQATAAELTFPTGVIADPSGIVYVIDGGANRVRKINNSGVITALAGHGSGGYSGDGGQATSAELSGPMKAAFDNVGNLYITDQSNNRIREVYLVLAVTTTPTGNVNCAGGDNGSATASASDGTTPYTYSWSGGQSSTSITGLSAGTYTVDVTDADGVTGSATVTITQPAGKAIGVNAFVVANVTCYGGSNGSVSATAADGISPYTYSWSPGGNTNATVTGLAAGTYTVTATDNNGCTATASATITQPTALVPIIEWAKNATCAGTFDGMALGNASGGTFPYTYSWSPGGSTNALITGLAAGVYTLTVTDYYGCTTTTATSISQPPVLTVTTSNIYSAAYALTTGGTPPYTYAWVPVGSTSSFATGISAGTYTVTVRDANGCVDSTVLDLTVSISLPHYTTLRSPRWSKRGMYVEFADTLYYPPINATKYIPSLVNYCRNNHITYVLLDGVDYNPPTTPYGAFYLSSAHVDPTYGAALEDMIDSLKTRGRVEQVGIVCYDTSIAKYDSNSYGVIDFDVDNFTESARMYNIGLPWKRKIDILSLDDEFWVPQTGINNYQQSLAEFHHMHLPMLRSMYRASRECDANYLRVEDYISPPMDINFNIWSDTAVVTSPPDSLLYSNPTQSMIIDSIGLYTDRILLASYTYYSNVLWNRGDWMQGDSEIGHNPFHAYYKKELWPIFSAENYSHTDPCYSRASDDFSGAWMRTHNETPDYIEETYYDSLSFSERHQVWTDDNYNYIHQSPMLNDTCFKIYGCMWYPYNCLSLFKFDTNTHSGAIPFYVDLGHDTVWHGTPITLVADTHGNITSPLFIWYNETNTDIAIRTEVTDTLTVDRPGRYSVLVMGLKGTDTLTAIDYVYVYDDTCFFPTGIASITSPQPQFKIYPNPASSKLNVEELGDFSGKCYFYLYDLFGQVVRKDELTSTNTVLNINTLANGVYIYRITDLEGKALRSDKLIIIHR